MVKLVCAIVGRRGGVFGVDIDATKCVDVLKEAIIKESKNIRCDTPDLELYLAKRGDAWLPSNDPSVQDLRLGHTDNEIIKEIIGGEMVDPTWTIQKWLNENKMVGEHAPKSEQIHVLVAVEEDGASEEQQFQIDVDPAFVDDLQPYKATALHLKNHVIVESLARQIVEVSTCSHGEPTPFIVLENSSGTGKTQMAFNLQHSGLCEVFYLVCAKPGDSDQRVYKAFDKRSKSFRRCVAADMNQLKSGSIGDIRGTRQLYLYGFIVAALRGDSTFCGPALRSEVVEALERRQKCGAKPCVFFLDEFPRVGSRVLSSEYEEREKYLRTMRNVFRSLSLAVVVSSTNGTGRNLLSTGERSRQGAQFLWCVVFPTLPEVARNHDLVSVRIPDQLKNIFKHSRPLFVKLVLGYMQMNPYNGADPLEYMNEMADSLAPRFCSLKRRSIEFVLGQLGLLLCSSFELIDDRANLIDSHFARLSEAKALELVLDANDELLNDGRRWKCRCVFSRPHEDMLLHLVMTGGRVVRPLKQPLHAMMSSPSVQQWMHYNNTGHRSNDGMDLDALVTAALVVASHRGGFGGVELPTFLGVLLHELGIRASSERVELPVNLQNAGANHLLIPFLSPPNVEWPDWFLRDWQNTSAKFDNLCRFVNADRIDFRTTSNLLSGEYKDYSSLVMINPMLDRMPDESIIHLVVTKKMEESYFTGESASAFLRQQNLQYVNFYRISKELGIRDIRGVSDIRPRGTDPSQGTTSPRVDKVVFCIELEPIMAPQVTRTRGSF